MPGHHVIHRMQDIIGLSFCETEPVGMQYFLSVVVEVYLVHILSKAVSSSGVLCSKMHQCITPT